MDSSSSLKCKQHKFNNCEFVQMNNVKGLLMICQECISASKGAIKPSDCIPISRIVEAKTLANLSEYVPFNHKELNEKLINDVSSFSIDTANAQIKDFFKELKKNFKNKINELIDKSQESMESLYNLRVNILEKYQQVSSIERFKEIIQSNSRQVSELESELNRFQEKQQNEANELIPEIKRFKQQRNSIEILQQPQKIIDNIFKDIESLELFNRKQLQSSSPSSSLSSSSSSPTNQCYVSPPVSNQMNEAQQTSINKSINSIINQITFLPSNLSDVIFRSTPIIERLKDKSIKITSTGAETQCFIEQQLIPTKKYIITIKAQTNPKDPYPYFFFGLMPYSTRLDRKLGNQQMCYNEISGHYGISKMVKGKQLHLGYDFGYSDANYWHHNDSRRYEIRIDLSKKFIRIASLPNYDLVAEFDDKSKITNDKDYVFAFSTIGDKNSVIFEDIEVVNEFDRKM